MVLKLSLILFLGLALSPANSKDLRSFQEGPGEPLYLTPLIKEGRLDEARGAALIEEFEGLEVISYSGFVTVNEEFNSNLFFWFFPAEASYNGTDDQIPIIFWSDGGPGGSCISTIFGPSGVFKPLAKDNMTLNPFTWHKRYHRIFVDNPVEVGFSHTGSEEGRIDSSVAAAKDIYEFLVQFFKMFPELQSNPFYNGGISYGGKYSTEIAHLIHTNNQNESNPFINLTGLIEDSAWIEAKTQIEYSSVLYGAGLISKGKRDEYFQIEEEVRELIGEGKLLEASEAESRILEDSIKETGFQAFHNLIEMPETPTGFNLTEYINLNETRRVIHVGNLRFISPNLEMGLRMAEDGMGSHTVAKLDELLISGYKALFLVGNVDVMTGHIGFRRMMESIKWEGGKDLANGNMTIWKVGENVAGYVTRVEEVVFVIVRNAGHGIYRMQPEWEMEAVEMFLG